MQASSSVELPLELCAGLESACVFHNLRRADRLMTTCYDLAFKATGLKATQFAILVTVNGMHLSGQDTNMTPVARRLCMDVSTLTRNLKVMASKGWVSIETGQDKRVRGVQITEEGKRRLAEAYPHWRSLQQTIEGQMGSESFEQLLDLLKQLRKVGRQKI